MIRELQTIKKELQELKASLLGKFTQAEAKEIGEKIGVNFETAKFSVEEFRIGLDIELEHGRIHRETNVTNDDPVLTGKIALAHLREYSDYYQRLVKMEKDAKLEYEHSS